MNLFGTTLLTISAFVSFTGVIIIAFGALRAIYTYITSLVRHTILDINSIRLELGYSIILGLEFMVGADIIQSIARPSYYDVGLLAILVLIRTFLSYYLNKELQNLTPEQKRHIR